MQKLIDFLRLIRAINLLIIALGLSLFYYLIVLPVHTDKMATTLLPFTHFDFALFVLSVLCIAAAGNIINDYFDFELDKKFKPERPLAKASFSLDQAIYLHALFAFAGIALGFYLGWSSNYLRIGYIYVVCVVTLYLYSAYLKKLPLLGNIVVSALTAFVFVLLFLFEMNFLRSVSFDNYQYALNILLLQTQFYAGFAFLTNLAREIVKTLEDREGDAAFDVKTIAVQFGENAARIVASLVLLVLAGGLIIIIKGFFPSGAMKEAIYLLVATLIPALTAITMLFVAKERKQYQRVSLVLKALMLLGILSIPAFYLFNQMNAS